MIRIVNMNNYKPKPDEILFMVDRTTPLGNPFKNSDCEFDKDFLCSLYKLWFEHKIEKKDDGTFVNYLNFIITKSQSNNIALGCWCNPDRCHAEVIQEYIEVRQKNNT